MSMVKIPPANGEGVQSVGWEDPLEEEMATHTRFLPGESHGQRSLEGYSPWGRRVRRDWRLIQCGTPESCCINCVTN